MEYRIKLTDQLLDEFEEICDYISNQLKNIDASNRLREKVIYNILLLENSPRMFTQIEKVDRTERQYRRLVVNNHIILYTVDELEKIVYIAHIYYAGRNYLDGEIMSFVFVCVSQLHILFLANILKIRNNKY